MSVKAGDLIHSEKPFAYVLSSKKRFECCDNCLHEQSDLQKCSACQYVYYCNKDCQRESWPWHKTECQNLKKISPRVIPDTARFLARLIVKLASPKGAQQIAYYDNNKKCRKFKDLVSHYSDIKKDSGRVEHFVALLNVLKEFFAPNIELVQNAAEIFGIFGRVCVNSFNLLDYNLNGIGVGIYLGASSIDHSCDPNAVAVFDGTQINIRMIKTINDSFDWSKLFISYIGTFLTTEERQQELKQLYYFQCECKICNDIDLNEKSLSAKCPNCDLGIVRLPHSNKCDQCFDSVTDRFSEQFNEVMEFTKFHLKSTKDIAYLDVCKLCLEKHKNFLHDLNLCHVKILENTFDASISLQRFDVSLRVADKLVKAYHYYESENHPMLGYINLMLAKILLNSEQVTKIELIKSKNYLKEAYRILCVTHGRQHSIFRTIFNPLKSLLEHLENN